MRCHIKVIKINITLIIVRLYYCRQNIWDISMISEEIVHVNGHPQKLVVFLHGYIDSAPALDRRLQPLLDNLPDSAVHIPQAPEICEILDNKRQWYSMHRFDPDDARKYVPTMEECASIYNRMGLGLAEAFAYLNPYLEDRLSDYGLEHQDLYLCGFSQGAMVAIYASLMQEEQIGGCVSFSGIITPHGYLLKHAKSKPDILLIHGDEDNLVRPESQMFTMRHLQTIGCNVQTYVVPGGQHRVTEDGLIQAASFINHKFIKKIEI